MHHPKRRQLPLRIAALLRSGYVLSGLSLLTPFAAYANCDNPAPTTGQTATCGTALPNPTPVPVVAAVGSNNVIVNVLGGAGISVINASGVTIRDQSQVNNAGNISVTSGAFAGITSTGAGNTVNNAATGTIFSQGGAGIAMQAGGTVINDGTITSQTATGVLFGGTAAGVLINRGTITGTTGVAFGAGNDRLEMLGGSIGGAVTQGDGTDLLLMSAGTLASLDQGLGADSAQISGGTVTGNIQQSGGIDDFVMTGGQVGSLSQGDNLDTFNMSNGRIVGAFEDGDRAIMTGGRIGRVDMKLDDNLFDMSGGTIDGNLVTGFGNDTIILSNGYIGGNLSVSGGQDNITVTGGTIGGEVRVSAGNDTFTWSGGGIIYGAIDLGDGTDTTTLRNLTAANMGATPLISGGLGADSLTFSNVTTSGISRFQNWETVAATNDTELTFGGNLTLGDSGTGTGTLSVDSTSTLFAGGTNAGVLAFAAGQLVNVTNAGRIDLTNGAASAADTFTIAGNYVGNGGTLFLQTQLGGDGSPSDKLAISGGTASGTTGLAIINLGGAGAATQQDGIMVVQALNGATTASGAFALDGAVAAGAFEYFLFKGGVTAGTADNWYLRSTLVAPPPSVPPSIPAPAPPPNSPPEDPPAPVPPEPPAAPPPPLDHPPPGPDVPEPPVPPEPAPPPPPPPAAPPPSPPPPLDPPPTTPAPIPTSAAPPPTPGATAATGAVILLYRVEAPTYAVVPPAIHQLGLATLGTFHERQGEQSLLQGEGAFKSAWARVIGQSTEQSWSGTVAPTFDGDMWGVQIGADVFARESESGRRDHVGLLIGRTRMDGDVRGFALGWNNLTVGEIDLDDTHFGAYWTHIAPSGAYLDGVILGSRLDGDATSDRGIGVDIDGDGLMLSIEGGYPFALGQSWTLEPQAQIVWQQLSFDDTRDRFSSVAFDADDAVTGRVGARLVYRSEDSRFQPYIKANFWHGFNGTDSLRFGTDPVISEQEFNAFEFGGGLVAKFNDKVSFYVSGDYTIDTGSDEDRKTFEGNLGMRVAW